MRYKSKFVKTSARPEKSDIKYLSTLEYSDFAENVWKYDAPFRFIYKNKEYEIPENFLTNFYSIPRLLRVIVSNNTGAYNESAGIHDWLGRNRKTLGMSLRECHRAFLASMTYQEMPAWRRYGKFLSVYAFNWMCDGKGDGTLPKHIKKAIEKNGNPANINYSSL